MIGHVVGKYKIREQIGEGGMGVVYRADHVMLGSPVAIKVLLPQFTTQPAVVERFFTEAKTTSAIRHPGIVQVFDFGRLEDQRAYIVMEMLRGENLTGFLSRRGTLDASLATQIAMQLLSSLEAAHAHGVIHRDVKPDNIFIVRDPTAAGAIRVKVLDFGIAKLANAKVKDTSIVGTPAFMAPEQCRGNAEIDARADLYAVGCILFQMLVGRPPFEAEGGEEMMAMHVYQPAPHLRDFAPAMSPELDALVAKMLAKSPADRTPSAGWALAALERLDLPALGGEVPLMGPQYGRPPPALTSGISDRPSRFPLLVVLVAIVLAIAAFAAIAFL
ncbi:MAG: serine/threonine protein kinase [Deltaproteobacteria bacterium]|nr:serine/threonine protein kinase [Deltaproteobacteria bacterium]